MSFRSQYLSAMQEQAPSLLASLSESGSLDSHLEAKEGQARQMWRDLTSIDPRNPDGSLVDPAREASVVAQINASLIVFP